MCSTKLRFQKLFFICVLCVPLASVAQQQFDFYLSNSGKDINSGTSASLPRKTIIATAPLLNSLATLHDSVRLGLKSDDIFNEGLVTSYPIIVSTYNDNPRNPGFAILNGTKKFDAGWIKQGQTAFTFEQDIPYSGFTGYGISGIGSYSYIYVTEVDKELEKTAPYTARQPLKFVASPDDLENTPGSFYSPINTTENPKHVFVHTSDGSSPNGNSKYSYEVTVRDFAINSTYQPKNRFENLWVRGYGAGIGMLPGGTGSYYNKIIFGPGAGIHHLAVRSGTIDHSLFLPGSENTSQFAVVFYDVEGLGRHCLIKNSMFLDINTPVYSHTSKGTNFGAVEMDHVIGFAGLQHAGGFMFTSNNDTVLLNNIYADGYLCGYNYGTAQYASISNSSFKDVRFGIGYSAKNPVNAFIDNVFIKTNGSDYTSGIYMQNNTSLQLTHSITYVKNDYRNYFPNAGAFVYGAGSESNTVNASGNIFICEIDPAATVVAANTNTDKGIATSKDKWNNNVYILLKGNKINWTVTNLATNDGSNVIQNFEDWKRQSGQDQNSLFFDLRNDPRGLGAIFEDPGNGNYELANTPEGQQVAALQAGMTNPPTCFLQKPSYEDAANYILDNKVLSVNTCRNPCHQNTIRVNNTFTLRTINDRQVNVEWNISEQQNIHHYEIQRAINNSNFRKIGSLPVNEDSSYFFIDDLQPGINYRYRLVVVANTGSRCYSDERSVTIKDQNLLFIYPNPSAGKILVSVNGYIGQTNFTIANLQGQVILRKQELALYAPLQVDLSHEPRGIYLLKMENSKGTSVQKIVLQ